MSHPHETRSEREELAPSLLPLCSFSRGKAARFPSTDAQETVGFVFCAKSQRQKFLKQSPGVTNELSAF